jgi:Putative beta barrel porin-7 (BBP7)
MRGGQCPEGISMKRMLLSLGVVFSANLIGLAQDSGGRPASLGAPRATLGLPRASSDNTTIIPTQHAETALPSLIPPVIRVPETTPPAPVFVADDPPMLPRPGISEDPKAEKLHAPTMSSPAVAADDLLFPLPANAPPFINRERLRFSHEYLMWWGNGFSTPALVTTGPAATNGIVGQPGVSVLYGNQSAGSNIHNGYRFGFAYRWRPCWGLDGRFFFLSDTGQSTSFSSDTISVLARPFTDINPPQNSAEIVASNLLVNGTITGGVIVSTSSYLWGADINARRRLCFGCNYNFDALIGYRYMNLTEELNISESSLRTNPTSEAPFVDANGTIHGTAAFDQFKTTNHFNGAQIGLVFNGNRGRWDFEARASIALGVTSAAVDIDGGQTIYYTNGQSVTSRGGLLALDSNIGHHSSSRFSVIPEATFNVGYNITPRWRIFVGYNLIYWSAVLRPGSQIDTNIDSARIPNFGNTNPVLTATPRPTWTPNYSGYFAQGLNFGLTFRW